MKLELNEKRLDDKIIFYFLVNRITYDKSLKTT